MIGKAATAVCHWLYSWLLESGCRRAYAAAAVYRPPAARGHVGGGAWGGGWSGFGGRVGPRRTQELGEANARPPPEDSVNSSVLWMEA